MDDELGIRIAELAGVLPGIVLCELHADRASKAHVRKAWKDTARRLRESANSAPHPTAENQEAPA